MRWRKAFKMMNSDLIHKKIPLLLIRRGISFSGFLPERKLLTQIQVLKLVWLLEVFIVEVFHEVDALAG